MSFINRFVNFLAGFELYLYYICAVLLIVRIFCHKLKKTPLIISLIVLVILAISISLSTNNIIYALLFVTFILTQFIFLKITFPKYKLHNVILFYVFINCINMLLISFTIPNNKNMFFYSEIIINTLTSVFFIILCISKIRLFIQKTINLTPKYILKLIIILLVCISISSNIFLGAPFYGYEHQWTLISRIGLMLSLIGVCLLLPVLLVNAVSSNHLKTVVSNYEKQINIQAEHYKQLAEANYEMRRFRHDFKNISIALEEQIKKVDTNEALNTLKNMTQNLENPLAIPCIFETGNEIADALLSDKQSKALEFNIKIHFNGAIPADILSPTDLCVVLGNTIDNAIEACQKLPLKEEKTIFIHCKRVSEFLLYTIVNPVIEKVKISNNYVTTTKENETLHGFGLYSLNSIVKKYDGTLNLSSTDDEFSVNIDLCINSNKVVKNFL